MPRTLNNEVSIINIANQDNDIKDQYTRWLIANEEELIVASRDYDVNEFFIGNDRYLYKTLTNIPAGTAFVNDSNVKRGTTIADALYQLYAQSPASLQAVLSNVEEDDRASKNYKKGQYMIWTDGFLYRIITDVSIGTIWATAGSTKNIVLQDNITSLITRIEDNFAPIEHTSAASQAYGIGKQFIYNGILYMATASISTGGTITPGTNCQASETVIEQVNEFNIGNNYIIRSDTSYTDVLDVDRDNPNSIKNKPHRVYQESAKTALVNMPEEFPQGTGFIGFRYVHWFNLDNILVELRSVNLTHPTYYRRWSSSSGWGEWYQTALAYDVPETKTVYSTTVASGNTATEIPISDITGYKYVDIYLAASPATNYITRTFITFPTTDTNTSRTFIVSSFSSSADYLHVYTIGFPDKTHFKVYGFYRYALGTNTKYDTTNQVGVQKIVAHN